MASSSQSIRTPSRKVIQPSSAVPVPDDNLDSIPEVKEVVQFTNEDLAWEIQVTRPAGITSLSQWGQVVLVGGKFKGQTQEEARQDLAYEKFVVGRQFTAAWALNLQNYFVACRRKQVEGKIRNLTSIELENYEKQKEKPKAYP